MCVINKNALNWIETKTIRIYSIHTHIDGRQVVNHFHTSFLENAKWNYYWVRFPSTNGSFVFYLSSLSTIKKMDDCGCVVQISVFWIEKCCSMHCKYAAYQNSEHNQLHKVLKVWHTIFTEVTKQRIVRRKKWKDEICWKITEVHKWKRKESTFKMKWLN